MKHAHSSFLRFRHITVSVFAFFLFAPVSTEGKELQMQVNGMVCAFCAQGVQDLLDGHADVAETLIDFDNSLVRVRHREGARLSPEEASRLIFDAGYDVAAWWESDLSTLEQADRLSKWLGRDLPSALTSAIVEPIGSEYWVRITMSRRDRRTWERTMSGQRMTSPELPDSMPVWWQADRNPTWTKWEGSSGVTILVTGLRGGSGYLMKVTTEGQ